MKGMKFIVIFILGGFTPVTGYSQTESGETPQARPETDVDATILSGEPQDTSKKEWEQKFIESNVAVSEWFDGLVEGVDLFLVGKEISNRRNESSLTVRNSTYSVEGDDVINKFSLIVIPRLHNLEEYWQVKFTSFDERDDARGVQRGYYRNTPQEENYGATLGLFQKIGNLKATFAPRIELADPLRVSHSLALSSILKGESFSINPEVELFAKPDRGVGFFGALNFNFELTPVYSLTLINEGEYEEKLHKLTVTNGPSIGQKISDWTSLSYAFLVTSHNRESYHADQYSLAVSWSHLIYRKILDYQIIPHVNFAAEDDFRSKVGMTLNLSLHF